MKQETVLSLVLVAACIISVTQAEWNQAARDHILKVHNDYRRNEGGCQINELVYDMDLEAQAKTWALGCVFEHELITGRGENLAYDTSKFAEEKLIDDSAQRWFDEKKDFSRGMEQCGKTCHYTQLVWDKTEKVGCYSYRCPSLKYGSRNAWYLVCFYTPGGNMMGQDPYQTQCDAPCRNGQTLVNGLCQGQAIIPCVDVEAHCDYWKGMGFCTGEYAPFMAENCRKTCSLC
ncbi:cysteine-rich secretory protein lccl domain-containing 2 [Plakobranchus ocellatus]|uniref:Cysteine-rich secretory protein lccl domain-containing 2 n=1 Tax=Plakobranchus ocellatus TaxID=259542 RepID=A0AAV4C5V2_9GAST|nr:cysteine-rich secretory protein lccl domain-containing 2 [Plakobranchus ocellatus]